MRVALLAVLLAVPVAAQPLPALTSCCPNRVLTVDPVTGDTTVVAEVGTASDWFVGTVGSAVVDVAGQRAFLVRNGRITTANLVTGEVTEGPLAFSFAQLAGYDAARDRLLAFTIETERPTVSTTIRTNYVVAYRLATQDTLRIARVGQSVVPGAPGDPDDTFASVGGPAVADGGSLFSIRNGRVIRVDLASGDVVEDAPDLALGELLGYDASADALYRLDRVVTVADSGIAISGRVVRVAGGAVDTLATVTNTFLRTNGGIVGDVYLGSIGVAVYDAPRDRVLLNRNGAFVVVDLGTGGAAVGPPAVAGVAGGALSARFVSADDAPGDALALRASPNPTRGAVRLAVGTHASARVEVLDALGRRVALLADGPTAGGVTWDAAHVPPGVYRVRVVADGRAASVPVTVTH